FTAFVAPAASSTIARSGKTVSVRFRLAAANGKSITAALGRQLAGEHKITVALAGAKIKGMTASCFWSAAGGEVTWTVKMPAVVAAGQKTSYTVTAREHLAGLTAAPPLGRAKNPEVVH